MKNKVNLLVKTKKGEMVVEKSSMTAEELVLLVHYLIESLEKVSGISHDEILEDIKYKEK